MNRSRISDKHGTSLELDTHRTPQPPSEGHGVSRRDFLYTMSAAAVAVGSGCSRENTSGPARQPFPYDALDSAAYLSELDVVVEVEDTQVFTEGPAVAPDGRVYFTNMRTHKILRWDPVSERLDTFRENTNTANGLVFD